MRPRPTTMARATRCVVLPTSLLGTLKARAQIDCRSSSAARRLSRTARTIRFANTRHLRYNWSTIGCHRPRTSKIPSMRRDSMKRRIVLASLVIVAAGVVALASYAYVQGVGPFARSAGSDAPMELAAASYPCGGADGAQCVVAAGTWQAPAACPAMAGGNGCGGAQYCAPDPRCCPDGCPSSKDGKCPNAGNCVCPKDAKGCAGMASGQCTGSCTGCPMMKAGTCTGMKGGTCQGASGQAMSAAGCVGQKSGSCAGAQGAACQGMKSGKCGAMATQAQAVPAQSAGGCPMAQAAAGKQASCQASCPMSTK